MSFLSRIFPFLFVDVAGTSVNTAQITALPPAAKTRLIQSTLTPLPVLASMSRDKNEAIQVLLAKRLATLVKKTKASDRETSAMLLEAIRQLTEESITPVRVALVSALKDIAHCPPDLARKFADDVERAVAEPIIRYSLSLSDQDLLELIQRHPQDWQTVTIAQRNRLSSTVSNAVISTGNTPAGIALIDNDGAAIPDKTMETIKTKAEYQDALKQRASLVRKIKRDVVIVTEQKLHAFLLQHTGMDDKSTRRVIDTVQRRVAMQDNNPKPDPRTMTETQIKDALAIGNENLAIQALAIQSGTSEAIVKRMIVDSGAAKPVIALCTKANFSMAFAVFLQQRLTRLPPAKIIYPKNGTQNPLSAEEIQWQWEFFGLV